MFGRDTSKKLQNYLHSLPLKSYVVIPTSLLFAAAMFLSAILSYQTATKLISYFLDAHSIIIANSVSQQLDDFFLKAIQNIQLNKTLIETGTIDADDRSKLGAHFLIQLKNTDYMTYVSMGFPNGEYIGAGRRVDSGEINLYSVSAKNGYTFDRYKVRDKIKQGNLISSGIPFETTKRDWYRNAVKSGRTSWYPVYRYAGQDALGVGVSSPVYSPIDHKLLGVLTSDLALIRISEYLKALQTESGSLIFISELSGNLVAASTEQGVYQKNGSSFMRYNLINYPDKRLSEAQKLIGTVSDNKKGQLFKIGQEYYHFNYTTYEDSYGLKLTIGVISSDQVFSQVYMNELMVRIILTLLFLASIGGLMITILHQAILPPIQRLVKAQHLIRTGDYSVRVPITGSKEIGILSAGFNEAAEALEKSKEIEKTYIAHEKLAALGGLASGVTHEVNTPLGIAITVASYMEKNYLEISNQLANKTLTKSDFDEYSLELRENLTILKSNLERASELIKGFKSIAVNQSSEQKVRFNVKELIDHLLISLKHEYKRKNHQIQIQCDDSLWLDGYPGALSQVLTNLLMNSFIHGFGETPNGIIQIFIERKENRIHLFYADNGKGMSIETKEKLYVPFYTTNRANGGTGIGMSIVHSIITEQLLGTISVESKEGQGVRFTITFPDSQIN